MRLLSMLIALLMLLSGCTPAEVAPKGSLFRREPPTPSAEPPVLNVYVTATDEVIPMEAEEYLAGVVAGEMPGDWPIEALKAQAILARTFMLRFITTKESMYSGADVSTDIREAQAYNAAAVNDRIREAVRETAGLVLIAPDGTLPYTWFHSHSGGSTSLARDGVDWQEEEPSYTKATAGLDSPDAPASVREWSCSFTAEAFLEACRGAGYPVSSCNEVIVGQTDRGGRAVTLLVDGTEINAARLRISLGSTVMRSTMLTSLQRDGSIVTMSGRGYGHGVGMPQWGAYALAMDGYPAGEIALYYYEDLTLTRVW